MYVKVAYDNFIINEDMMMTKSEYRPTEMKLHNWLTEYITPKIIIKPTLIWKV